MPSDGTHPTWGRRAGKFALFLSRGVGLRTSWWLAGRDAVKRHDYRKVSIADLAAAWDATRDWNALEFADGAVRSARLSLRFQGNDLLARGYRTAVALTELGFCVQRAGPGLELTHPVWRLRIDTDEEISMVHEIFVEGCYDLRLAGQWNVLDIGANVGMASLFFAAQPWVHRVFAFEPFEATADAFDGHMAHNPSLAGKVSLQRCGVDEVTESRVVDYHPTLRGSMSVHGLGGWRGPAPRGSSRVSIRVRRASEVWRELAPALAGRPTLAKIDCEGSEYGVLRDLEQSDCLPSLDLILIEWHDRDSSELADLLRARGFALHVRAAVDNRTQGIILAWREAGPARRA